MSSSYSFYQLCTTFLRARVTRGVDVLFVALNTSLIFLARFFSDRPSSTEDAKFSNLNFNGVCCGVASALARALLPPFGFNGAANNRSNRAFSSSAGLRNGLRNAIGVAGVATPRPRPAPGVARRELGVANANANDVPGDTDAATLPPLGVHPPPLRTTPPAVVTDAFELASLARRSACFRNQ